MRSCVIVMLLLCDQIKQVRRLCRDATRPGVLARSPARPAEPPLGPGRARWAPLFSRAPSPDRLTRRGIHAARACARCACVRVPGGRIRTQLKLRDMWLKEVQGNKEKSNLLQANPPTTTRCLHA